MNKIIYSIITLCVLAPPVLSQSTTESAPDNASLPVEANADNLVVDSSDNSAIFEGNAVVTQGILNLQADKITVHFEEGAQNIKSVTANGKVKFTNGLETAEAQNAKFDVPSQVITFSQNVILRQGQTILTGNTLTYNITTSRSKMSGNVKTIFAPK